MSDLRAVVAAGVLRSGEAADTLLQGLVTTARATFGAKACSIMVHDPATAELEWVAVSGEGEGQLVGRRLPATTGLAGWVRASGEPIVVEDVRQDPRFAREVAESTGYVPAALMIAPLLEDDEAAVGVLNVLDRTPRAEGTLAELSLLGQFAAQATAALGVRRAVAEVQALLDGQGREAAALVRAAEALRAAPEGRRDRGVALLHALAEVLEP